MNLGNVWIYIIAPIFEIVLMAMFFYWLLNYLKSAKNAAVLSWIILLLIFLTFFSYELKFRVINYILNDVWFFFPIGAIIIFQQEIRRLFTHLSTPLKRKVHRENTISEIITATLNLAKYRHGGLIVIEQGVSLSGFMSNYSRIDAKLTNKLIETIFYPDTLLHDGAIIVRKGRIRYAGCILPLSSDSSLPDNMGTRHRAALGICEESDALAIVISEETGDISIAHKGKIRRGIKKERIRRYLEWLVDDEKLFTFDDMIEEEKNSEIREKN